MCKLESVRGQSCKTYRPPRGASADPLAPADATILAGAACLTPPGTRLLTAVEKDKGFCYSSSEMDQFRQKHPECPWTFLRNEVILLYIWKSIKLLFAVFSISCYSFPCYFWILKPQHNSGGEKTIFTQILHWSVTCTLSELGFFAFHSSTLLHVAKG